MVRTVRACCRVSLVAVAAALAGCGADDSAETYSVSGKVTVDGQPSGGVRLSFYAPNGAAAVATTESKDDGTYLASFTARGKEGEYKVTAAKMEARKGKSKAAAEGLDPTQMQMMGLTANVLPRQYESKDMSGLSAKLRPGENAQDFALRMK